MNLIENAIWQVETNLRRPMSLEDFARICRVTPPHLTRAFASATGQSLMRYYRARRLSEAARILALGVPDILGLALETGYRSHEAFTRAFREQFGVTPETVRDARTLNHLTLMEPMIMDSSTDITLASPRIESHKPLLLVGMIRQFPMDQIGGIPSLWDQFNTHIGHIPHIVGKSAYGVSLSFSEDIGCDYMCGIEFAGFSDVPADLTSRTIPAATYAKFRHPGHITLMRQTIGTIWSRWLPASGYKADEHACLVEFYPPDFDPRTGSGGFEIWMPVVA